MLSPIARCETHIENEVVLGDGSFDENAGKNRRSTVVYRDVPGIRDR